MIHFVTHFDEQYAAQGLVMIESLRQAIGDYDDTPQALCLTDECVLQIGGKAPTTLLLTRLEDVENEMARGGFPIRELRQSRTWKEYCWTLEPAWCLSQIESAMLYGEEDNIVVYVDADQLFFADPIPGILAAMSGADVALTPHHFPPGQEHKEKSVGRFNFGLAAFRACEAARRLVRSWLEKTLDQCGESTAGHQRYLDEWPAAMGDRFVTLAPGYNIGPWQLPEIVSAYRDNGPAPLLHRGDDLIEVVSFHFHEFRRSTGPNPITLKDQSWNRTHYQIHPATVENIYLPYERALLKWL